jgi:hypothetical protein
MPWRLLANKLTHFIPRRRLRSRARPRGDWTLATELASASLQQLLLLPRQELLWHDREESERASKRVRGCRRVCAATEMRLAQNRSAISSQERNVGYTYLIHDRLQERPHRLAR